MFALMSMRQKTCSSLNSSFSVKVNKPVSCRTENVIYLISCTKCSEQYVGQTGREFKKRMKEHLGYINNFKFSEPTGKHFNLPNHDISMFKCIDYRKVFFELQSLQGK